MTMRAPGGRGGMRAGARVVLPTCMAMLAGAASADAPGVREGGRTAPPAAAIPTTPSSALALSGAAEAARRDSADDRLPVPDGRGAPSGIPAPDIRRPDMTLGKEAPEIIYDEERLPATPSASCARFPAILLEILQAGYVHLNAGEPSELYVWRYFFALPLDALDARQRVELFTLVTAGDYRDMQTYGAYIFYRAAITPQGRWLFFVAGD